MQLPPYVQVLFECEDPEELGHLLDEMNAQGWAANNLCFGSSTGLLQKVSQDMLSCAFRYTSSKVQGKDVHVTSGSVADQKHASNSGRVALCTEDADGTTATQDENAVSHDQLVEVFRDGTVLVEHLFSEIRRRAECRIRLPAGFHCNLPESKSIEVLLQEETTATSNDASYLQRGGQAWREADLPPATFTQPMEVTEGSIEDDDESSLYSACDLEEGFLPDVAATGSMTEHTVAEEVLQI